MEKTGKGISIEESPKIGGVGSEISATIMEEGFDFLEAPFVRLGAKEKAIPCNKELESDCFPDVQEIVDTAVRLMDY
jgi:pyruvate/2-oxoglutarate/acetoin dehydrogenase E1 component